jgi:hypothetical protein
VTVPTLLSLGIGIASRNGIDHNNPLLGFGMVTVASLCPIVTVQILAVSLIFAVSKDDILASNTQDAFG